MNKTNARKKDYKMPGSPLEHLMQLHLLEKHYL